MINSRCRWAWDESQPPSPDITPSWVGVPRSFFPPPQPCVGCFNYCYQISCYGTTSTSLEEQQQPQEQEQQQEAAGGEERGGAAAAGRAATGGGRGLADADTWDESQHPFLRKEHLT